MSSPAYVLSETSRDARAVQRRASDRAPSKTPEAPATPLHALQCAPEGALDSAERLRAGLSRSGVFDRALQGYGGQADTPAADDAHARAASGVQGSGAPLPHLDRIQQSFGRFDVRGVQAYSGARASRAAQGLGASAYAYGDKVAFAGSPDLHTAAHEAAHVVQQRAGVSLYGGVGEAGDRYEQHADAVADAVVAGKSAEPLLAGMAGGGGGKAVQKKQEKAAHVAQTTVVTVSVLAAFVEVSRFGEGWLMTMKPSVVKGGIPRRQLVMACVLKVCQEVFDKAAAARSEAILTQLVALLGSGGLSLQGAWPEVTPKGNTKPFKLTINEAGIEDLRKAVGGHYNQRGRLAKQAFAWSRYFVSALDAARARSERLAGSKKLQAKAKALQLSPLALVDALEDASTARSAATLTADPQERRGHGGLERLWAAFLNAPGKKPALSMSDWVDVSAYLLEIHKVLAKARRDAWLAARSDAKSKKMAARQLAVKDPLHYLVTTLNPHLKLKTSKGTFTGGSRIKNSKGEMLCVLTYEAPYIIFQNETDKKFYAQNLDGFLGELTGAIFADVAKRCKDIPVMVGYLTTLLTSLNPAVRNAVIAAHVLDAANHLKRYWPQIKTAAKVVWRELAWIQFRYPTLLREVLWDAAKTAKMDWGAVLKDPNTAIRVIGGLLSGALFSTLTGKATEITHWGLRTLGSKIAFVLKDVLSTPVLRLAYSAALKLQVDPDEAKAAGRKYAGRALVNREAVMQQLELRLGKAGLKRASKVAAELVRNPKTLKALRAHLGGLKLGLGALVSIAGQLKAAK